MKSKFKQVFELFKESKSFLIGSHVNPDGDAIGSMLAIGLALESLGKEVIMFSQDGVPENLSYLKASEKISKTIPDKQFDVGILVDVASPDRAGDLFEKARIKGPIVAIDHHRIENSEVDVVVVDEKASSAGEVVYKLLKEMKISITEEIASAIYCSLVVDTGFFKYSNTSADVLCLAAELVGAGANPWTAARNLEESYKLERFYLLSKALGTIKVHNNGKYATMDFTQEMLISTGATVEDTEEFASIPRSIKSVKASALFRETPDGKVRISLRSKEDIDVARVAGVFGGGGHQFAAGCTIVGTLDEAKEKIGFEINKC